jgi:hypothetical protein
MSIPLCEQQHIICSRCGRPFVWWSRYRDGGDLCLRCWNEALDRQWDERRKRRGEEPEP